MPKVHDLDGSRRLGNPRSLLFSKPALGVLFVVLGMALHTSPALAPSGRFPSLDLLALTSERVELVRVVAPQDTSHLPIFIGGRVLHYQVVNRLLGSGPSPGSVTVHVLAQRFLPLEGDTLLVFWELRTGGDREDGITVVNLTDPERCDGMPALTSDFRVPHNRDSILAIVVLRAAMVRARCPLGDERRFSSLDFVEGRGCVERWMPDDSEAAEVNPWAANVLASPADAKMLPSCRKAVARRLRAMRADGTPAIRRAAVPALQSLDGQALRPTVHSLPPGLQIIPGGPLPPRRR